MKRTHARSALPVLFLIAALTGSVHYPDAAHGATATQEDQTQAKKSKKKKVRATLVEPAERVEPALDEAEPDEAEPTEAERSEAEPTEPAGAPAESRDAGAATGEPRESPSESDRAPSEANEAPASARRSATAARDASSPRESTTADENATGGTDAPATARADAPRAARDVPTFDERVEVIEVFLDAIVKDGKEHVVGLGPEDFVVEEEGRAVEVTSAEFYGTEAQLSASGEGDVARADRYFILLFHDRSRDAPLLRSLLLDAGQQARRWAEQELLPNDQVAVLMYDVRLKVYTDFTRDREQIVEAIARAVSARKEPDRAAGRSKERLRPAADSPSLLLNLPAGRDLMRETRRFEYALELLGRAAEGIVGRKNLMLFSVGFGDTDPGGVWTPDPRFYPDIEQSLNDGNIAVYAIDLVGARRLGSGAPGIASSLSSIAADTAGLYLENFTTFQTPMRQVTEDTPGYYLLSYRSEYPRGTSGYREVKVETRDRRYTVRARKGYLYGEETRPLGVIDEDDEPDDEGDAFPEPRVEPSAAPEDSASASGEDGRDTLAGVPL